LSTVSFVFHALALDQGQHRLLCFLLGVEDDVAGGVVDPLYFEMRVDVEVVADELVAHVVHSEQIPSSFSELYFSLVQIGVLPLFEKF